MGIVVIISSSFTLICALIALYYPIINIDIIYAVSSLNVLVLFIAGIMLVASIIMPTQGSNKSVIESATNNPHSSTNYNSNNRADNNRRNKLNKTDVVTRK